MSEGARVESIDAIKDFRVFLVKFADLANRALGDAESDINKTISWLEGERLSYWSGKIRKCQEGVVKAEEALRSKKLFKDSTGQTASGVEEMKALGIAKRNLADAQQKLNNVKGWGKRIQKEYVLYRGHVSRFANDVQQVPGAVANLANLIQMLEKYTGMAPASVGELEGAAVGGGGGAGEGGAMTRSADEAAKEDFDPKALRERAPGEDAIGSAKALDTSPALTAGQVTPAQLERAPGLTTNAPGNGEKVLVTPGIESVGKVYLHRLEKALGVWLIGSVEGAAPTHYNSTTVGGLVASRPDLAPVLSLPMGTIVVVNASGLAGVFDDRDRDVLKAAATPAEAPATEVSAQT